MATRKFGFPERAGMTYVIGQIYEEWKCDSAFQRITSKLICQMLKDRAVVGVWIVTTKIGVLPDRYNSPKTAAGG
jgi:hypothetical protein